MSTRSARIPLPARDNAFNSPPRNIATAVDLHNLPSTALLSVTVTGHQRITSYNVLYYLDPLGHLRGNEKVEKYVKFVKYKLNTVLITN